MASADSNENMERYLDFSFCAAVESPQAFDQASGMAGSQTAWPATGSNVADCIGGVPLTWMGTIDPSMIDDGQRPQTDADSLPDIFRDHPEEFDELGAWHFVRVRDPARLAYLETLRTEPIELAVSPALQSPPYASGANGILENDSLEMPPPMTYPGITAGPQQQPLHGIPAVHTWMPPPQQPIQVPGSAPMYGNVNNAANYQQQQAQAQAFSFPPSAVMAPQLVVQASGFVAPQGNFHYAAIQQQQPFNTVSAMGPAMMPPQQPMQVGGFGPTYGNFTHAAGYQQQPPQTFSGPPAVAMPPQQPTPADRTTDGLETDVLNTYPSMGAAIGESRRRRPVSLRNVYVRGANTALAAAAAPPKPPRRRSATPSNRLGQKAGLPQALKIHKRDCKVPQEGCVATCPLLRDFPADHQRLATTPLKPEGTNMPVGRNPGDINKDVPVGYRFKLWVHYDKPKQGSE